MGAVKCDCSCHEEGSHTMHCMPCCEVCPHCKVGFTWGIKLHIESCKPPEPVVVKDVEIAVGFGNHTWANYWLDIEITPDKDGRTSESEWEQAALTAFLTASPNYQQKELPGIDVSFVKVLHIPEEIEDDDGIQETVE